MKKWFSAICSIFTFSLQAYSIVFIHLGPSLPDYLPIALSQARLFNRECPIYLIANERALQNWQNTDRVTPIPCESLSTSDAHREFRQKSSLDRTGGNGFWFYTSERFFYLEEFMTSYESSDVFHLEYDVMLYSDLKKLLPAFHKNYRGMIGATFEGDHRCVPGFLYFSTVESLRQMTQFMASRSGHGEDDMTVIGHFKRNYHKIWIESLPLIPPAYLSDRSLRSTNGSVSDDPNGFINHFDEFHSIFDAAAIGQYLSGMNPAYHGERAGFINPNCFFQATYFTFEWEPDEEGRLIPIAVYNGQRVKLNNLHIHGKNLRDFSSQLLLDKARGKKE